tara:strand:+ start:235 stop:414 length:180 start_codon:yes stop_codon:yes gene_type:complete
LRRLRLIGFRNLSFSLGLTLRLGGRRFLGFGLGFGFGFDRGGRFGKLPFLTGTGSPDTL